MVEQKLVDYVRKASRKGFSFDKVSLLLKRYGYGQRDIDEAIWLVSREQRQKEEERQKKGREEQRLELPPHPEPVLLPDMPKTIKPVAKPIHDIEKKAEERIQQKFFPEKERKKHAFWVVVEMIGGIVLFAAIGILMYLYLWPALLNVR